MSILMQLFISPSTIADQFFDLPSSDFQYTLASPSDDIFCGNLDAANEVVSNGIDSEAAVASLLFHDQTSSPSHSVYGNDNLKPGSIDLGASPDLNNSSEDAPSTPYPYLDGSSPIPPSLSFGRANVSIDC